jgi:hypothetical protein
VVGVRVGDDVDVIEVVVASAWLSTFPISIETPIETDSAEVVGVLVAAEVEEEEVPIDMLA